MDEKEMSLIVVQLVEREVNQSTQLLIDAKVALKGMEVREEYEENKVEEWWLKMGNKYTEYVNRQKAVVVTRQEDLDRWTEIRAFVITKFIETS